MPTNMDKALYRTPTGVQDDADMSAPDIEIEIEDPEAVDINVDGMQISIGHDDEADFNENLAETLPDSYLATLAQELEEDINNDLSARKDWEDTYKEGITLLGLKYDERTEPWNGACGVFHPMITEAVVRFQAETITETFPAGGPVRTTIIGKETTEKKEAAVRVEEDMNYQLTDRMTEFRPEHERMLWSLPATGSAFKKVYFDPNLDRQTSVFVPAEDIILPYGTTELATCPRITHRMRKTQNDIVKLQVSGFYVDCDLGEPQKFKSDIQDKKDRETGFSASYDERYELYECHVDLDIEGEEDLDKHGDPTGIALPYVVTMVRGTNKILAIRRNWREDDKLKSKRQHFVHYQYIPGFGAYGFGLFHLIGGYAKSATSLMRQLVDAGTLSNLPGGLKSRGLRIKGDDTPIAPGEFRDVDIGSGSIRDNILPLPYKEPSATLFQLLGTIVEEGRRFAATADIQVSDMSSNAPVGTTLAILERTLKVMSAVQARVHYAFKQELRLLAGIIRDYTDPDYKYDPEFGDRKVKQSDYSNVDIIPVSDPNAATMSQRVVQYQAALQLAQMAPQLYDLAELHREMLEVLGIKNAAKILPLDEDKKPQDPVTENMAIMNGKPVKAFSFQDHEAHIKVHMAASQDPLIAQMVGQNPQAAAIAAAGQAHLMEHVAFLYRNKIEMALGTELPPQDEQMQPEVEAQLSRLVAEAAPQVLAQSQAFAAQQQAQQQAQQAAQDPVLQMQAKELAIKQQDIQTKAQLKQQELAIKDKQVSMADANEKAKLQLEQQRLQAEAAMNSAKTMAGIQKDKSQFKMDHTQAALNMGLDMARARQEMTHKNAGLGMDIARTRADLTKPKKETND